MGLSLLFPLGLAALAALLLPVLLHLQRRTPQRRTEFAALRWLASRLRPRRRIRIEEPWLLLLRLLLVACVALLLARPAWTGGERGHGWVLVHPALDAASARRAAPAPARADAVEWRWLAPGFPALEDARPTAPDELASLLREADARLPTRAPMTVLVPPVLEGLDAERPRLARTLDWHVVPAAAAPAVRALPASGALLIVGGPEAEGERFVRAAAQANGRRVHAGSAQVLPGKDVTVVAWLSPAPVTAATLAWVARGGTLLLPSTHALPPGSLPTPAWRDGDGQVLLEQVGHGAGRILRWTRALEPQAMPELLEPRFARGFEDAIREPAPPPTRGSAESLRPRAGARAVEPPPRPLDAWLAGLAIALFAAERLAATRAARRATP